MSVNDTLLGAIAMACLVIALFFFRFWRSSRDRFFLLFSVSFLIEGLNRLAMALSDGLREDAPEHYLLRLLAYGLIVAAILGKNWPARRQ